MGLFTKKTDENQRIRKIRQMPTLRSANRIPGRLPSCLRRMLPYLRILLQRMGKRRQSRQRLIRNKSTPLNVNTGAKHA
mgnify:CR=1 FL=1